MIYYIIKVMEISRYDGLDLVESIKTYKIMPEEFEKIKKFTEDLMNEEEE